MNPPQPHESLQPTGGPEGPPAPADPGGLHQHGRRLAVSPLDRRAPVRPPGGQNDPVQTGEERGDQR